MKKKIFTLLLAVAASIGTVLAWDYERLQGGDLFYNLDTTNRIAEVTYSSCEELIPGTGIYLYNGNRTGIKSVNIPSQVTYNGITYNVTSIGDHAFHSCGLLASVYIPNSIMTIGNDAFNSCNLQSLEIPNSVTSIGNMAFNENGLLTSVTIGTGLKSTGSDVFRNCVALKDLYYTGTFDEWCSKAWNPGMIAGYRLFINNSEINDVVIPNSVTSIGNHVFSGCASLTSITIPTSVTSIGDGAFSGCSGLTSISIPNSVTNIGSSAFQGSNITSVVIGNRSVNIGAYAFMGCGNLVNVTYGSFSSTANQNSVISIGNYAFDGCSSLTSFVITDNVNVIGGYAFNDCNNLKSITIGENVDSIGAYILANCKKLKSITWNAKNCKDFNIYGPNYPPLTPDKTYENISSLIIGDKVDRIPANLCHGCQTANNQDIDSIICLGIKPAKVGKDALESAYWQQNQNTWIYVLCGTAGLYKERWGTNKIKYDNCSSDEDLYFRVVFQDWNYVTLSEQIVEKGHAATAPANPTREGYTFTGWDEDFSNVQSNLIITAQYTQNTPSTTYYTVTFKDWNGTILKSEQVEKGHSATAPENPTREGYTFTGWDKDFSNVQSDLIVTAQYTQNTPSTTYYTVTFKDWDGTVLKTQQVEKGHAATAPTNPTREGYTFIGWDKDFTNVQSNLIVTAKYQKNGSASSFVGFESTNSHSLATQIYSEGLVQNISNVALVETDAASHKYSINLVNGGEGTFSMGGVVFSYTNAEAGKTAYKTYVQYIQPNGSDREIRIPTEKGQQVKVVLVEACAGILVDGVSKDFVAGENVLTSQNGTIVLKNGSAKPKISAILPLNSVGSTDAITVRLKASSAAGWSKVNLYYWGEGVTSPAWPGVTIKEDAEGWYSYTFASVTFVNIIWNDGNNQTQEISNVTESTCYSLKSTSGKTIGVNVVECEAAASVSVTGVSLNKKTLQMVVGNTATLTASVLPANASNKSVTWTSSNTATATVSSTGTISAKAEGVTTITCKTVDGNFTAECYVVVSAANSEYTFSYEPTNATVINYTATELSYTEIPENNCVFAALSDNAHTLNLMYVGSLVNGVIPQGNYKITSTLQNGTFCYSVGGDDQYDYGSYLATDYDSEGYYTSSYYIIAGDIIIGSNNDYTVKIVSANGTDINVTYAYAGTVDVEIVPSEIKAFKILRDGQIFILRGEKEYTLTGQEVK